MVYIVAISVRIDCNDGVQINFLDKVEASLDCVTCQRANRTVIISPHDGTAICTPTGHAFPARITGRQLVAEFPPEIRLILEYEFEAFVDRKYKELRPVKVVPTWGRIHFEVICPHVKRDMRKVPKITSFAPGLKFVSVDTCSLPKKKSFPDFKS